VCLGAFASLIKNIFKQIVKDKVKMREKKKQSLKVSDIFQNLSSGGSGNQNKN
jgi:hypothetical protein